jgi:hypothetical protein
MLQLSKILQSRNSWKHTTIECRYEIRELKKTKQRHLKKIATLKLENRELKHRALDEKNNFNLKRDAEKAKSHSLDKAENIQQPIDIKDANQTRILCILLTLNAVVSYRSIPRILELFKSETSHPVNWVPHFTSVINWSLRLGLGLLTQVQAITKPWVAIIDHSIDIGTKKALVVLRVEVDALSKRGSAIRLEDCECIGLTVSDKVTGDTICLELEEIFHRAGKPVAIIKDRDVTLQKGVRLWSNQQEQPIPTIDDIGHVIATALKAQFEKLDIYKRFTSLISHGAKCLRQTELAFLMPPKLRSKGRFQSIGKLGEWAEKMLNVFAATGHAEEGGQLAKLRKAFPNFCQSRDFIVRFASMTKIISQIMEALKNNGLNNTTYKQCVELSKKLPRNSTVKKCLQTWLKKNLTLQKKLTSLPLPVSSDIIESLFGNFKHIIERSPQADMNRTVLLIPALCGRLTGTTITQALKQASQANIKAWEKKHIPYTIRKKRHAFFKNDNSQNTGKCKAA